MGSVNWAALAKDAGDIKPVPQGKYEAVIEAAELKTAASGREYWKTTFKVQSGPNAGRKLYNNFVLVEDNPNALRAFFINMQNLGLSADQLAALGSDKDALTRALIGRQAVLTISHRDYQGQTQENVDRIERHPSGPFSAQQPPSQVGNYIPTPAPAPSAPSAPIGDAPAIVTPAPASNAPKPPSIPF